MTHSICFLVSSTKFIATKAARRSAGDALVTVGRYLPTLFCPHYEELTSICVKIEFDTYIRWQ